MHMTNTINGGKYYMQSSFVQTSYCYTKTTQFNNDIKTAVLNKNNEITGPIGVSASSSVRFQAMSFSGRWNIGDDSILQNKQEAAASINDKEPEPQEEIVKSIRGLGTIAIDNNNSYIMTASEVIKPGTDAKIVRVHVNSQNVDVNIDEVDPKNATVIEMFAYCQYADAHGTGVKDSFGSFHSLKAVTDPFAEKRYLSLEKAISEKQNWDEALSKSKASFTKVNTGEKLDASMLLKMLEETRNLLAQKEGDKDLGNLSDEEWEKLLGSVDKNIRQV